MTDRRPWIWHRKRWPVFTFDPQQVASALAAAYQMHGVIEGKASAIGLTSTSPIALDAMSDEVVATAAIEGERLPQDTVRSSVKRRLGLPASGPSERKVDGLVAVINDATSGHDLPLDHDRLFRWQSALFPGGTSGLTRIGVGRYRDHQSPMQIVSGAPGREVVHYEAPPSHDVPAQMQRFLQWCADTRPDLNRHPGPGAQTTRLVHDGLARAAIAHLWFETIHPFEDGNGRIGRAIVDLMLSQHLRQPVRLYSLSRQLLASRSAYYEALNAAQRGDLDVSNWVAWFARQCTLAFTTTSQVIDRAIQLRRYWEQHDKRDINERQRKVLQRLMEAGDGGFEGGMTADKYIKLTGASKATATRDLTEMVGKGQMWTAGAGRATRYYINVPGWSHGVGGNRNLGEAEGEPPAF